jgi:hypothetical protein
MQEKGNGSIKRVCWCFLILVGLQVSNASFSEAQTLSPSGITFTASAGAGSPSSQKIRLIDPVPDLGVQTVKLSKHASWLQVTPMYDAIQYITHSYTVSVNTSGLGAGIYTDTILSTLRDSLGIVRTTSSLVTLNLTGGTASPRIALSATTLTFSGSAGGSVPEAETINLTNPGGGTLNWNVGSSAPWLLVTPTTGTTTTDTDTITVTVNTAGIAAGSYAGLLTFSGNGSNAPQQVLVNLMLRSLSSTAPVALTAPVTLSWSPNSEADLTGYKIKQGTTSRAYTTSIYVGNVTTYTLTGLTAGQTYYFAISAIDKNGNESGLSAEVRATR